MTWALSTLPSKQYLGGMILDDSAQNSDPLHYTLDEVSLKLRGLACLLDMQSPHALDEDAQWAALAIIMKERSKSVDAVARRIEEVALEKAEERREQK